MHWQSCEFLIPVVVSQKVIDEICLVCVQSEKYASWVNLTHQLDCSCRGEAEVHILDFKTTWSEFQMPSQTAPAEAKPRCVYSILKPHGQSFITSSELVQPRKYPLRGYILGVLTHTTALDRLWGGDETLIMWF